MRSSNADFKKAKLSLKVVQRRRDLAVQAVGEIGDRDDALGLVAFLSEMFPFGCGDDLPSNGMIILSLRG